MFNNDGGKYFEDVCHLTEDGNLAVRREEFVDLLPQLLRQSVAVILVSECNYVRSTTV